LSNETHAVTGPGWFANEPLQGVEYQFDVMVVSIASSLQSAKLARQVGIADCHLAKAHESAHHRDIDLRRSVAPQYRREHGDALLRECMWPVASSAVAAGT
jgi:hypothetical protein